MRSHDTRELPVNGRLVLEEPDCDPDGSDWPADTAVSVTVTVAFALSFAGFGSV